MQGTDGREQAALRSVKVIVRAKPARKDNNRIIARRADGRPFLPKSHAAQTYEKIFKLSCAHLGSPSLGSKEKLVIVSGAVWYEDKFRGDLSIELILDCLQKAGVLSDDRYVVRHDVWKGFDKSDPRVELTVTEIDAEGYDWKNPLSAS